MRQITINSLTILAIVCFSIVFSSELYKFEFLKKVDRDFILLISLIFSLITVHIVTSIFYNFFKLVIYIYKKIK